MPSRHHELITAMPLCRPIALLTLLMLLGLQPLRAADLFAAAPSAASCGEQDGDFPSQDDDAVPPNDPVWEVAVPAPRAATVPPAPCPAVNTAFKLALIRAPPTPI